jgi:hypothetical protein
MMFMAAANGPWSLETVGVELKHEDGTPIRRRALAVVWVDVDMFVDVDVDVDVLLVPRPTAARTSAAIMVAAVKCFSIKFSRKLGRYLRQPRRLRRADVGQESC